jgi:hypothetical protein
LRRKEALLLKKEAKTFANSPTLSGRARHVKKFSGSFFQKEHLPSLLFGIS